MEVRMKNRLLFGFFVLVFLTALVFTGCPSLTSISAGVPGTFFLDKFLSRNLVPGIATRKLVKGGNRRNLSK
jgi:hypothetical protein